MEEPKRGTEGFGLLDLGGGAGDFRCTAVLMTWGIFMSHSEEDPTHKRLWGESIWAIQMYSILRGYKARKGESVRVCV